MVGQALGDEWTAQKTLLTALDFDHQGQGTFLITVGEGEKTMTPYNCRP